VKRSLMLGLAVFGLFFSAVGCDGSPEGEVKRAIREQFPSDAEYNRAFNIAKCESNLNPKAVSPGGGNWGLFQINKVHRSRVEAMGYSWDQILNPYVNADVARAIYDSSGWRAWSCA
jgi:hypothetical protein